MKSDIATATGRATIRPAKISQDERFLDSHKPALDTNPVFAQVVEECRLQHHEDVGQRAMSIAHRVTERAIGKSDIYRMASGLEAKWERLANADDRNAFELEIWRAAITFLSHFYALPEAKQRQILGGWRPSLELMTREDIEQCSGFGSGATVDRVLRMEGTAKFRGTVDAFQCSENNQGTAPGVHLTVSEGISQEVVLRSLQGMLQMVRNSWPELMAMEPDSFDKLIEESGPLAGDKSRLLDGEQGAKTKQAAGAKGKQLSRASVA